MQNFKRIIKEKLEEKGMTINKLAMEIRVRDLLIREVMAGKKTSRPLVLKMANYFQAPELLYIYEKELQERRAKSKKVSKPAKITESNEGTGTEEKETDPLLEKILDFARRHGMPEEDARRGYQRLLEEDGKVDEELIEYAKKYRSNPNKKLQEVNMNNKQLLKKIGKAIEFLSAGKETDALNVLFEIEARVKEKMEKESRKEDGKEMQHLIGWYLELWDDKPPEMFKFSVEYKAIIAKHLKELIHIYKRNDEDIEQLKRDYESFRKTRKEWNGLLNFRNQLPNIKNKQNREWTSPENSRGKDYYLKNLADD